MLTFRRSSGPDSLLIWTHKIRGINLVQKLESSSDIEPAAIVKVHAGERFVNVMTFGAENDLTPVTGSDPHVGVGGYYLGGGHGPLTGKYGTGADQVVGMVSKLVGRRVLKTTYMRCLISHIETTSLLIMRETFFLSQFLIFKSHADHSICLFAGSDHSGWCTAYSQRRDRLRSFLGTERRKYAVQAEMLILH